jgi:8-oxo-dGTP pyrophosphatase MutT (NUDIX family)
MTADAIPAATLVLFKHQASGPPHVLMVERAGSMAFAAGALVFPGGRIDPGDRDLADTIDHGLDTDDAAARIAAIRETLEESGIGVAIEPPLAAEPLALLRARLHEGAAFGALIAEAGLRLALDRLEPFARWRPNFKETRTFDTRFYLAALPDGAPDPVVDATENVRVFWASAADVLAACDRGEGKVIFPTRRNLERLAQFADFDAAIADARRHPVTTITPWIEEHDGERRLHIPEGAGYPVTSESWESVRRG